MKTSRRRDDFEPNKAASSTAVRLVARLQRLGPPAQKLKGKDTCTPPIHRFPQTLLNAQWQALGWDLGYRVKSDQTSAFEGFTVRQRRE